MEWFRNKTVNKLYIAVVLIVVLNVGATMQNLRTLAANDAAVLHTHEVLAELQRALSLLKDAETGQRGYLLTGRQDYLAPYTAGTNAINECLDRLASLTADNPRQQKLIASLRRAATDKLSELALTISLRDQKGLAEALEVVLSDLGKLAMDDARQLCAAGQIEEERLLLGRREASRTAMITTIVTFSVANVLVVLLMGGSYYLTRHVIPERARAEARFRGLLDAAPDAMVIVDKGARIVLVNAQTEALFGYTRSELLGREIEILVPSRFQAAHRGARDLFLTTSRARPMGAGRELFARRKDGSEFPAEISLSPFQNEQEILVSSAIRDCTARREVERTLARQARLLDVTHDSMIVVDLDGTIMYWNHGSEALYGWSPGEAIGQNVDLLLRTEYSLGREQIQTRVIVDGVWDGELIHCTRHGRRIVVASRWVLQRTAGGEPESILKTNTDITDRKRMEETLEQSNAQLEASNKELEAFSYSVSHDLRAPLRAIDGFSRILLDDYAANMPGDAQHFLKNVRANAQQMGRLVDGLLNFSRLSRVPIATQLVDPVPMVRKVLDDLFESCDGRQIEFAVGDLPSCRAEPMLLKLIWTNLISNAIKYTRGKDPASIEIGALGGQSLTAYETYFVKDNGVGFDMRYIDKMFGVFQRLHRAEDYEGTGVGLAIVQRIINRHGGRVWAEGCPNRGATFFFTLEGATDHER
jgi:PAS domain S-box-containing protein